MTEWEEVEFSPGPQLTCEEQELYARQHPPLDLARIDTSDWLEWRTSFGLTLRLPNDFQPLGEAEPDRMLWITGQGESVFVVRHEGGNVSTIMQPQEGAVSFEFEGHFCGKLAGRDATVGLWQFKLEDGDIYGASSDAGITPGTGIGVVVWAVTSEQRHRLLGALTTIQLQ